MAGGGSPIGNLVSTFDSPKVAKAKLPPPIQSWVAGCFLSQMVTFLTIAW
jgi:hypothetical protein